MGGGGTWAGTGGGNPQGKICPEMNAVTKVQNLQNFTRN